MSPNMTYEKIPLSRSEFDGGPVGSDKNEQATKKEHPARKAARVIKNLHNENISMMDAGHVFMRDGVDVSEDMRKSCEQQIKLCDEIMKRAENMDPSHWSPSLLLCEEVSAMAGKEAARRAVILDEVGHIKGSEAQEVLGGILPEIGNYGHRREE